LQEERQLQELRQLQAAHGQKVQHTDNSLDWMYEGPNADKIKEQEAEEYLLGKIYKQSQAKTMDFGSVMAGNRIQITVNFYFCC
jgi:hypothetical protein